MWVRLTMCMCFAVVVDSLLPGVMTKANERLKHSTLCTCLGCSNECACGMAVSTLLKAIYGGDQMPAEISAICVQDLTSTATVSKAKYFLTVDCVSSMHTHLLVSDPGLLSIWGISSNPISSFPFYSSSFVKHPHYPCHSYAACSVQQFSLPQHVNLGEICHLLNKKQKNINSINSFLIGISKYGQSPTIFCASK